MSNLNKRYFETRKAHNESYSKKGWIIWILIGIGAISFFIVPELFNRRNYNRKLEQIQFDLKSSGVFAEHDTLIAIHSAGAQIIALANCRFKEYDNSFVAFEEGSSSFSYLVKRIISDPDFDSGIKQWENSLLSKNTSYEFSNFQQESRDQLRIETVDFTVTVKRGFQQPELSEQYKRGG